MYEYGITFVLASANPASRHFTALTVYNWVSIALEFAHKMTFSPSTPPTVPSKEEECPSSDACSIVHALPPICSPHSAASAETLRRLKGQIAHTKREEKRERRRWGSPRKRSFERRRERGGRKRANPLHSNAIIVCIWNQWGFVAASLSLSLSITLCTLAPKLIAIATAISTVHDINMVACRRQREAFKGT